MRLAVPETRAEDVALLYAAAAVTRRHKLPGEHNVPGWESVAKALDRMAELLAGGTTSGLPQDQLDAALAAVRKHPGATAAEIGTQIRVPRDPDALKLLRELERRGLVIRKNGQGAVWWNPSEIFGQPGGKESRQ